MVLEYDHLGFVIDEKDIKENVYLPNTTTRK